MAKLTKVSGKQRMLYESWWSDKALCFMSNISSHPFVVNSINGNQYERDSLVKAVSLSLADYNFNIYMGCTYFDGEEDYFDYVQLRFKPQKVFFDEIKEILKQVNKQLGTPLGENLINVFWFALPSGNPLPENYIASMLVKFKCWTPLGKMLYEHTELPKHVKDLILGAMVNNAELARRVKSAVD